MVVLVHIACCRCHEPFGMSEETYDVLQRNEKNFHCPWGHPQHFNAGPTEVDRLRLERDRLRQSLAEKDDQIALQRKWRVEESERRAAAERRASAARGQVTRLKNRAAAGVCPCCNRSFGNLRRHMEAKHKGFALEETAPIGVVVQ